MRFSQTLAVLPIFAVAQVVSGCRCSSKSDSVRPEASQAARLAPAEPPPSASATPHVEDVQAITPPVSKVHASVVLADEPSEHLGEQLVPPAYWVHRVRGAVVVSSGSSMHKLEDHTLLEAADSSNIGTHTIAGTPLTIGPLWMDIDDLAGSWPNDLWADAIGMWVTDGARIYGDFDDTYHGVDGRFTAVPLRTSEGKISEIVTPWSQGRLLGLESGHFRLLSGGKSALPSSAAGSSSSCPTRLTMEAIAALPTGDLYAIGRGHCEDDAFLVEHWTDDSLDSKSVTRLPAAFASPLSAAPVEPLYHGSLRATEHVWLSVGAPNAIYALRSGLAAAAGQTRLARFDGTSWQMVGLPEDAPISDADVTADGSLWLVVNSARGYLYSPEAGWREVTFPLPALASKYDAGAPKPQILELTSVLGFDAKRGYFATKVGYEGDSRLERGVVFSTDPKPLHYAEVPDGGTRETASGDAGALAAGADAGAADPAPFDSHCTTPFVILFSVSDAAPPNFAYPATRDAMLGAEHRPQVKFLEFSLKGHRTLGASALNPEQARMLVQLISEKVKGSKPTLVCYAPTRVIREVKLTP